MDARFFLDIECDDSNTSSSSIDCGTKSDEYDSSFIDDDSDGTSENVGSRYISNFHSIF